MSDDCFDSVNDDATKPPADAVVVVLTDDEIFFQILEEEMKNRFTEDDKEFLEYLS